MSGDKPNQDEISERPAVKKVERNMTNRERAFVKAYSETGSGTEAAKVAYNVSTPKSAANLGSQVLSKPHIQKAIAVRFEEEWPDADRDIVMKLRDIVTDEETSNRDAIAAIRELARLRDLYPASKKASVNINLSEKLKLPGDT